MCRWHWLMYLDGPRKGRTALWGFWPPEAIPAELPDGYRLASGGAATCWHRTAAGTSLPGEGGRR
jgi:hypothetical protein